MMKEWDPWGQQQPTEAPKAPKVSPPAEERTQSLDRMLATVSDDELIEHVEFIAPAADDAEIEPEIAPSVANFQAAQRRKARPEPEPAKAPRDALAATVCDLFCLLINAISNASDAQRAEIRDSLHGFASLSDGERAKLWRNFGGAL